VADWENQQQKKWGLECTYPFSNLSFYIDFYYTNNPFIFQIYVASEERAKQMKEKFKTDLEKIFINK
jgi:hypothetical protein